MPGVQIVTFYKFKAIAENDLAGLADRLIRMGQSYDVRGLTIIAPEGLNCTLSGLRENLEAYVAELGEGLGFAGMNCKWSEADRPPFNEFKVKLRPEIVTLDAPNLVPPDGLNRHLSPKEWNALLKSGEVAVLDTRNSYETRIGKFRGAIDPGLKEFNEFPEYLVNSGLDREKPVLIYCTGGIRCEKAILEMDRQGFKSVFQLEGGILNYLQEYPHEEFEGECFVFDYRVAVDQDLKPSTTYRLCPHCGQAAAEKITCRQCGVEESVCAECLARAPEFTTCSKNCAHHFKMGHKSRRIHWDGLRKRGQATPPRPPLRRTNP